MIALAYFLGSDYTEGVTGIGIVNAMEIIQAFPFGQSEEGILYGLEKFRDWLKGYDFVKETIEQLEEKKRKRREKQPSSASSSTKKKTTRKRKGGEDVIELEPSDEDQDGVDEEKEDQLNEVDVVEELTEEEKKESDKSEALVITIPFRVPIAVLLRMFGYCLGGV